MHIFKLEHVAMQALADVQEDPLVANVNDEEA